MEILAYTYDADYHCITCTENNAAVGILKREPPLQLETDDNGIAFDLIDREGNAVHPVFSTDEPDKDAVCGTCYQRIFNENL